MALAVIMAQCSVDIERRTVQADRDGIDLPIPCMNNVARRVDPVGPYIFQYFKTINAKAVQHHSHYHCSRDTLR